MNEADFHERIDELLDSIEEGLEAIEAHSDEDLDYENAGGVLTVTFENGTTMVFSRQPPTRQLWLATRSGGYHFEFDAGVNDWRNTRDESLFRPFVVDQMKSQAGLTFTWP